ncbi:nitrite reductase small subunit NirD [Ferrimonas marina]|uniref:Nitrite reductase (NADH) small subunit n=1 Tax=Ferrimonas marina TaxID=299255 RepID=A0A1M5ZAE2_9GAMM|nr:nitrite reductase small subunit NirD [Ferrimonas marina]SHI21169.1 nitrite reductase (NADH) small subunit [Ferrimonas marina]
MNAQWQDVCPLTDIPPNSGVCALLAQRQVALFRTLDDQLFAIDNRDPIGGANVLSRGLLAQIGEQLTVASPLYKHHFCLTTGQCLQDDAVQLTVYPVRCQGEQVQLALPGG